LINDFSDTLNLKSKYGRNAILTININSFNEIKSLKLDVIAFERWKWHVFDSSSPKHCCFHIFQLKFTLFDVIWHMVYWCLHYISWLVARTLLESNGYPECATGLYAYSEAYLSYDFTGATPLPLCEKHGNLQLTSYLVYNVVPCVGKLARKSLCIRASFY